MTSLITALLQPQVYDHPVAEIQLFETHISWVILTGDYAYKIKKPVNFGFLNFSSLEQRKYYCEQELLLNRRLAPELYLEVIGFTGTAEQPQINGCDQVFEYAVKMRQFDPEQQLDKLLQQGKLSTEHIDQLADTVASFHQQIEVAVQDSPFGSPAAVWQPIQKNFDQIRPRLINAAELARLDALQQWSQQRFEQLKEAIITRKQQGFIRNCHGDMHLANITLIDNKITVFDCIEFNDNFRWIDVISEIAFTTMDLIDRQRPDLAARILDRYLQRTGDYAGLALLQFYQVYRALVRAKVAIIRHSQAGSSTNEQQESLQQYSDYSQLAETFTQTKPATLYIAHGVSGSGKTTLSQPLLEHYGMIRLRSDVERKCLFGLTAEAKSQSETDQGIYNQSASQQTYQRLIELTRHTLQAGYSSIVDATFLKCEQRQLFHDLAQQLDVPFVILHFHADETLLQQWISERQAKGKDASEATIEVLEHQLKTEQPLTDNEAERIIAIDSGKDDAADRLIAAVESTRQSSN
jgi:aminoglycoside phosphotransferase family enzyme/predicted kinase